MGSFFLILLRACEKTSSKPTAWPGTFTFLLRECCKVGNALAHSFRSPFASAKDLFIARRVAEDATLTKTKAAEEWKTADHEVLTCTRLCFSLSNKPFFGKPYIKEHTQMKEAFAQAEREWMATRIREAAKEGRAEARALQVQEHLGQRRGSIV